MSIRRCCPARSIWLPAAARRFPVDKALPRDAYRVLGYRQCGERAVRVDILERLADLIRPALAWRESSPGEKPAGAFDGRSFVVTQAMTSLTGSAGEDFASILRALGYRMDRRPPLPPKPVVEAPAEAAPAEATPAEPAAAEAATETPAEAVTDAPAEAATDTPVEAVAEVVDQPVSGDPAFRRAVVRGARTRHQRRNACRRAKRSRSRSPKPNRLPLKPPRLHRLRLWPSPLPKHRPRPRPRATLRLRKPLRPFPQSRSLSKSGVPAAARRSAARITIATAIAAPHRPQQDGAQAAEGQGQVGPGARSGPSPAKARSANIIAGAATRSFRSRARAPRRKRPQRPPLPPKAHPRAKRDPSSDDRRERFEGKGKDRDRDNKREKFGDREGGDGATA